MQKRPSADAGQPFVAQRQSESLAALHSALQEAKNNPDNDSGPDDNDDASQDEAAGSPSKPARRPKRARACIACRNMKIRCLPVEGQDACLGCSKVNRDCVMPGPARKRQKTVHKVAELEKKINALTDALIAQQAANPTPPNDSPVNDRQDTQSDLTRTTTTVVSDPQRDLERLQQSDRPLVDKQPLALEKGELDWGCQRWDHPRETLEPYVDIISRGLLDMATATGMFEHYVQHMLPFFPIITFPTTITAQDVRTSRPMLFLAILTIAAPSKRPDVQSNLVIELTRQLSERILFVGEKSLEIVQAILVYVACYSRGKFAKDLTFNQLIHSAVVMCLDLGMGKRYKSLNRDATEEGEIRRTWVACYYFASNVSILLRHPSLVRWTQYLEESITFLSGPTASDHDRWLCSMARIAQLAEEISLVFNMDDPSSNIKFSDTSTQYHLKAFEKRLTTWHNTIPASIDPNLVTHISASLNLYMHEIAIHADHNIDDFRPGPEDMARQLYNPTALPHHAQPTLPAGGGDGASVSATHVDALAQCVASSHRTLDAWLNLSVSKARCAPNLGIVWNTYAIVALIKLHGLLHAPDSQFGEIFEPDLRIEYYLGAVIERLQVIAADGLCPPAEAFVYVVRKLRSWYEHKRSGFPESSDDGGGGSGRDGGFVTSHRQHADDVLKMARERDYLPSEESMGVGQPKGMGGLEALGQQQSQGLVGTSSMPSSQLNPGMGLLTGHGQFGQSQSQIGAGGGFGIGANGGVGMGSSQYPGMSDLNVAFNAASYNINWDELNFSQQELSVFDEAMGERGWMGYLI